MNVAIVNDSPLAREALRRIVEDLGGHRVLWQAADGLEAQVQVLRAPPELILMDLFMPLCDGVEATRAIMATRPCPILVVTASVDAHVDRVFQAMGAGALDAIDTPLIDVPLRESASHPLLTKMAAVARIGLSRRPAAALPTAARARGTGGLPPLVALGASSGGPGALAKILATLPDDFPAALLVAQHVDGRFASRLAQWLDGQCALPVCLGRDGELPRPGRIYLAPGGSHLELDMAGCLQVVSSTGRHLAPSVDRLFRSLIPHARRVHAAGLLTGMGQDGAAGLLALRQAGVLTFAQDRDSATVYGMPKAALEMGAAEQVLSLDDIVPVLLECLRTAQPLYLEARG